MKAQPASFSARALPWLVAGALGASSTGAAAGEEWPPRTAPRVPGAAQPAAPKEQTAPPAKQPAPPPVAPVGAAVVEGAPPPAKPRAAATGDADAVTATRVAPAPPSAPVWGRLVGLSENRFFARTPGSSLVLFPGGLLNVDARSFRTDNLDVPQSGFLIDRARLELAGLARGVVGFNVAADLAHGPSLRNVDNYVSVAPWADRLVVQAGQFDAPFTLDNRISDRSLDFLQRSVLAGGFAIPRNKQQGAMAHGTNPARSFYYAAGGFFGDGQTGGMGRAWVAPFSFGRGPDLLRAVTVGGSVWLGQSRTGSALPAQTTQGGFVFFQPSTRWLDGTDTTDVALRTRGTTTAVAVELNAPLTHKLGARAEWALKRQPLDVVSTRNAGAPVAHGGAGLDGWAAYGQLWYWALGDDRDDPMLGDPGLQLPTRLGALGPPRRLAAIMLAARLELLSEELMPGPDAATAADVVSRGTTKLTAVTVGANVWVARRVRATLNYGWNHPTGSSVFLTSLTDGNIHELMLRVGLAL